jgi:hypothetical protein
VSKEAPTAPICGRAFGQILPNSGGDASDMEDSGQAIALSLEGVPGIPASEPPHRFSDCARYVPDGSSD